MKKVFSILICLSTFFISVNLCDSATTFDGLITLDFFEDTSHGSPNVWQLDFTVNDIGGGVESLTFTTVFFNVLMDYNNELNVQTTEFYSIGYMSSGTIPIVLLPRITSSTGTLPIPTGTTFNFFAQPTVEGDLIIGDFYVDLHYTNNLLQRKQEWIMLTGPVGVVPEPISMSLFSFGALLLYLMRKKKNH